MEIKKSKTITITSVKGGVGKTTTAISLAGIYSMQKKKVLIIDLDFYASAVCAMLNIESKQDMFNIVDDLNNNRYTNLSDYVTKYNNYIDVIASPKDPRLASKISSNFLSVVFAKAELKYDVILIDTNYFLNEVNLTAFDISDTILYVISNDAIDLKNIKTMVSIFKDMEKDNYKIMLNSSTSKGRNKFSRYDIKAFVKHDIDYYIKDSFYIKAIDSYIDRGIILTLDKKIRSSNKKVIADLEKIAADLIENKKER